jgi:hypothetical protein
MKKLITIAMAVVVFSGCATVNKQVIDKSAVLALKNQTITHTTRKTPDFSAMTAGKAVFGLLGAVAMISEGNGIVSKNNIADPADSIALGLATALEEAHGSRLVTPPAPVDTDDATQIATRAKGMARFIIDAQTINWSFGYFPTDWSHYRLIYTAKARLIDTQTRAVVAEGFCKRIPESNTNAPTYEQLLMNEAALLKQELATAANECVRALKTEMLSL